jgi:hypothetical protein
MGSRCGWNVRAAKFDMAAVAVKAAMHTGKQFDLGQLAPLKRLNEVIAAECLNQKSR